MVKCGAPTTELNWLRPRLKWTGLWCPTSVLATRGCIVPEADRTLLTGLMPGVEYVVTVTAERGQGVYPSFHQGQQALAGQGLGKFLSLEPRSLGEAVVSGSQAPLECTAQGVWQSQSTCWGPSSVPGSLRRGSSQVPGSSCRKAVGWSLGRAASWRDVVNKRCCPAEVPGSRESGSDLTLGTGTPSPPLCSISVVRPPGTGS